MRKTATFLVPSTLVAAAIALLPHAQAGDSGVKSLHKILFCGVEGPGLLKVGTSKSDKKKEVFINARKALNQIYSEFVTQLKRTGVTVVDAKVGEDAVKKARDDKFGAARSKLTGAAAGMGNLSPEQMQNIPPEARAMIQKQMAGGGGMPGAGMAAAMAQGQQGGGVLGILKGQEDKEDAQQKMHPENVVVLEKKEDGTGEGSARNSHSQAFSDQSWAVAKLCNRTISKDTPRTDARVREFLDVVNVVGADGYLFVSAALTVRQGSPTKLDLHYLDKSGKQIWSNTAGRKVASPFDIYSAAPEDTDEAFKIMMNSITPAVEKAIHEAYN